MNESLLWHDRDNDSLVQWTEELPFCVVGNGKLRSAFASLELGNTRTGDDIFNLFESKFCLPRLYICKVSLISSVYFAKWMGSVVPWIRASSMYTSQIRDSSYITFDVDSLAQTLSMCVGELSIHPFLRLIKFLTKLHLVRVIITLK